MSAPNRASALLRAVVSRPVATGPRTSKRFAHRRVPLPYDAEHGLPGFLSPNALRTVAVDWQEGVLNRLDELVRGTELEEKSVLQTLKEAAQDPTRTLAFNYASEALNNSFFLSTLSPTPSGPTPSSSFSTKLAQTPSLGSFPALVSHFSAHVSGLHPSSGAYVWLVTDPSGNLGVVGTYAGGTVLVKERAQTGYGSYAGKDLRVLGEQVQVVDAAGGASAAPAAAAATGSEQVEGGAPAAASSSSGSAWHAVTPARGPSSGANAATAANGGLDVSSSAHEIMQASRQSTAATAASVGANLHPLACISVHPHCYLEDYGLWGRDEYVKSWWGAVDWTKVEQAYDAFTTRAKATR
ncbi:Fe-Mn family superoxide dismutase [Rhodotorula taiwanensis]|uniref:Fe-Mn family superoxide dismutase n=1 Tax=Rhodotorula taiwanensis TaxID=741276 RepID=A0A2S5BD30_9BASI|nr:Fe-Mn family superoxide dismutase [Rhodotorula taiwanensis]